MQILTISNKDSRPEVATTALLAATGLTKISITLRALPSFDLVEIDCAIYIDQLPDFQVIDRLQQSRCPSILLADQDFPDSQCLFIPFGILDRSDSVSIGINIIRDFINSIQITDLDDINSGASQVEIDIDESPDANIHRRTPEIHQIHQARRELNFFESLATG
jgi:hypothetical protein